jgi:hypothetical protein
MANAFVQAYMDTALALRVNPARQYSGFFDQQVKDARDALEKAQAKVSAFQKAKGIIATDERLDVENARLNELSSQLVAAAGRGRRIAQPPGPGQPAPATACRRCCNPVVASSRPTSAAPKPSSRN